MLSTTQFRLHENSDNLQQAKKGLASQRKPLQDKAVNEIFSSNSAEKQGKGKEKVKENVEILVDDGDKDLLADVCSYKEVEDDYEDIWPKAERFQLQDIVDILDSYANRCSTPNPKLSKYEDVNPIFLEASHFDRFMEFEDEYPDEESVGEVSLPTSDFDDFSV